MINTGSKKQNIIVVIVAIGVVILAALTTLVATGVIFSSGKGGTGYKNVTFTDAVVTCKQEGRDYYGDKLKHLVVDNHSSRYDQKQRLYKIFLKADVADGKRKTKNYFVNCFIKPDSGRVSKFEGYEDKKTPTSVIRKDDTNMFGWPR